MPDPIGHFLFKRRKPKPPREDEKHYRESAEAAKLVDNLPPKPKDK